MRGLKPMPLSILSNCSVASFTDAWIETPICPESRRRARVASFTDAWIETNNLDFFKRWVVSHLLQMRGLKQYCRLYAENRGIVASFTDAWIETY